MHGSIQPRNDKYCSEQPFSQALAQHKALQYVAVRLEEHGVVHVLDTTQCIMLPNASSALRSIELQSTSLLTGLAGRTLLRACHGHCLSQLAGSSMSQ